MTIPTRIRKKADFAQAVQLVREQDPILCKACTEAGLPTFKMRKAGFESLLKIVVEQQLSTASANAIWRRLKNKLPEVTPELILSQSERNLRSFGLSGPKIRYVRALSEDIECGRLNLNKLGRLSDEEAMLELMSVLGIGRWTAEIYLLFCLARPNVWPSGDVAVQSAHADLYGLSPRLSGEAFDLEAEKWQPLRGVAALILWNYYRHQRNRPIWE